MNLPVNYENITIAERRAVREEYVKQQNGLCCHCGKPLLGNPDRDITQNKIDRTLFPPKFFNYPVHLHHDHITGNTIGAVHSYCNAVLWQYHNE